MQTQPAKDRRFAKAASVVVALVLIGLGGVYVRNPTVFGTGSTLTTYTPTAVIENGHISNGRLSISDLQSLILAHFFGSAVEQALGIQVTGTPLTETLTNVTLTLPDGSSYYVPQGTLQFTLTGGGLQAVFSGQAIQGQFTWTSFTLDYLTALPSSTKTTATNSTNHILGSDLSSAFTLLPSSIQSEIVSALNSSPNPGAQVSFLSTEIQGQASILNQIPGLAGHGADYAAAFLLNLSTAGTSLANSAYSSLLGSSTTTTTTTTTTNSTSTRTSST